MKDGEKVRGKGGERFSGESSNFIKNFKYPLTCLCEIYI